MANRFAAGAAELPFAVMRGCVELWGIPGVQIEAVLAAACSLVTVERLVDEFEPRSGGVLIPGWVIDAVSWVAGGLRPSYSLGITDRDNDFYRLRDQVSRDRDPFRGWMDEHVLRPDGARAR